MSQVHLMLYIYNMQTTKSYKLHAKEALQLSVRLKGMLYNIPSTWTPWPYNNISYILSFISIPTWRM